MTKHYFLLTSRTVKENACLMTLEYLMNNIQGYKQTENIGWHNRRPPTVKTGDLIPSAKLALGIVAEHSVI